MPFVKLDCGIITSSLWSKPAATRATWIAFLACADRNGYVRVAYSSMQRIANVTPDEFDEAVACFEGADPESRTPDHDGRRIERVDGGWVIINYERYRGWNYSSSREAVRKREYRSRSASCGDCSDMGHDGTLMGHRGTSWDIDGTSWDIDGTSWDIVGQPLGHSASASASVFGKEEEREERIEEGDARGRGKEGGEGRGKPFLRPSVDEVSQYCRDSGYKIDAQQFVDFYESKGWKVGRNPMKDWRAAVRTWVRRDHARPKNAFGRVAVSPDELRDQAERFLGGEA